MDIQLRWRYSVTEALRIAKADSKSSILILLDLSAAFDTINHQILLSTLTSLGITGIPLCWFESYLTGRSFKVAWGGEESRAHQLVTGVPQGSVLGPLLFSTYTTSPGPIIQAHGISYHCYADDTQLYLSFRPDDPTVAARISGCLADISAWMKQHHLQLNLAKTELFVFPATPALQHDLTIQIDSSTITPSSSVRIIGVIFDDQLTFKDQIRKNCSILQVCIAQHQKDQGLPYTARCTTSCPGPCHFLTGLLQCSSGLTSIMHNQTFTDDSECCSMISLQRTQKGPCHTFLYLPALASVCSSHQVQDTDACV